MVNLIFQLSKSKKHEIDKTCQSILKIFTKPFILTRLRAVHLLVVNDHCLAESNALPARSSAPISIAATYLVFGEKSCVESNIAVLPSGLRETIPVIAVVSSAFFTVNVFD